MSSAGSGGSGSSVLEPNVVVRSRSRQSSRVLTSVPEGVVREIFKYGHMAVLSHLSI